MIETKITRAKSNERYKAESVFVYRILTELNVKIVIKNKDILSSLSN